MTYGGYGGGPADPFGGDPFGAAPSGSQSQGFPAANQVYGANQGFPSNQGYPPLTPSPDGDVNTLSTLSIVFAVIFAPAGAALGHVALHQIRQRGQRGRERALIGLTLSYVIIVAAIIALVIWLLSGNGSPDTPAVASTTATTTTTTTRPAPPPPPRTTVITAPPTERPTVTVEELHVGDCVELTQNEPDPNRENTNLGYIYRSPCIVKDGVLQVTNIVNSKDQCPNYMTFNNEETIFACLRDFKG